MSQGGSDKQIAGHTHYSGNNSLLHETSQHWQINVLVGKSNASVNVVVVSMCKEGLYQCSGRLSGNDRELWDL